MRLISASEVIAFHDRILNVLAGVSGMSEPGRAEAIIHRVQNRVYYEGVEDLYELAATYWVAIARGHIFNDGNKRTSLFITTVFLARNGILIRDEGSELEELTVKAATGEMAPEELAQQLRYLTEH